MITFYICVISQWERLPGVQACKRVSEYLNIVFNRERKYCARIITKARAQPKRFPYCRNLSAGVDLTCREEPHLQVCQFRPVLIHVSPSQWWRQTCPAKYKLTKGTPRFRRRQEIVSTAAAKTRLLFFGTNRLILKSDGASRLPVLPYSPSRPMFWTGTLATWKFAGVQVYKLRSVQLCIIWRTCA